jgi:outer membrane protein OmpA-like peptidoglycan-associated protein
MKVRVPVIAAIVLASAAGDALGQQPGDHPLTGRYEGSEIETYRQLEFDEYDLPVGAYEDDGFAETRTVEGRITWVGYRAPDGRSTLEVFRNYQEKLGGEGFEELFVCESVEACGYWFGDRLFDADPEKFLHAADTGADEGIRYLAARRSGTGGAAWAQVVVYDDGNDVWTRVRVIEEQARETDKIVVEAEEIAERVGAEGRVALRGVHFDTDEATIRPESEPQLQAIADFLDAHPGADVFVVGHTDMRGTFDHNLDLSRRRAEAVVSALVRRFGVGADRLTARGVGPLAPAATNRTDEGRASNRRVVLVER